MALPSQTDQMQKLALNPRLVIVTNGNYFARLILTRCLETYRNHIAGVVIITGDYKARSGLRALWMTGKGMAVPYFFYKVLIYAVFDLAARVFPQGIWDVEKQANRIGLPIYKSVAVNASDVRDWISYRSPDLLVSVSCPQRIGGKLLSIPKLGGINVHSSLLSAFAGLAPYYWVLSTGQIETGTTIHRMTLKFDQGNILVQKRIPIEPRQSAFELFKRLAILGSAALEEGIGLALSGMEGEPQDLTRYSYFSNPTWQSYLNLRRHGHVLVRPAEILRVLKEEMLSAQM